MPLKLLKLGATSTPMRRYLCLIFALLPTALLLAQKPALPHRILIVGTNTATFNGQKNGTFLVEIAYPFAYWRTKGLEVHVVTPQGGAVALYHKGDTLPGLAQHLANPEFQQAMAHSLAPRAVKAENYGAIYFPGGYGAFLDVCTDKHIARLAARIHTQGGWIASVGHGAAALVQLKHKGQPLVRGVQLTCFPTWAEQAWMKESDFGKALPFDMEARLRSLGAQVSVPTEANPGGLPTMIDTDKCFVTEAFADAALLVAEELVEWVTAPPICAVPLSEKRAKVRVRKR